MKQSMNRHGTQQEQGRQMHMQTMEDKDLTAEDRPAEIDELDFEDDERHGKVGEPAESADGQTYSAGERAREAGLTGASVNDEDSTADDLTPENLMAEDGARSPNEPGGDEPAEWELTEKYDVGGGHGLDEAELARRDPLDKKPWDGDTDEPLQPLSEAGEDYLAADNSDDNDARD